MVHGSISRRRSHRATPSRAKRRIAVITGSRADFGLLRSVLRALANHTNVDTQLVVTGMHLLKKFGRTADAIRADGWKIAAEVEMQSGRDAPLAQAEGLANGVSGLARALHRLKSDLAVVLGDRIEALAGALAASTTHRFLAHIHGGDVAVGDCDDAHRHAITKLAHFHFPATTEAARRIVRLGEHRERVFCVGAPGLDEIRELLTSEKSPRANDAPPTALVVQHPVGRSARDEGRTMLDALKAVFVEGLSPVIVYPNSDPGHDGIIAAIRDFKASHGCRTYRSLGRRDYLRALMNADVLVGNSSSGIIEATFAGTPVVNIGHRQDGRLRSGRGIIDCDETPADIRRAIRESRAQSLTAGRRTRYGDGRAGARIADVLATLPLEPALLRKKIAY